MIAGSLKLVLQYYQVLAAEANYGMHLCTVVMELLKDRIGYGAANTSANHGDLLSALSLCGLAKGAHKIMQAIPFVEHAELQRGGSHSLHDYAYGTFFGVIVIYGNGNTLAILIHTKNYKLARLRLFGDQRSFYLIKGNGRLKNLFPYNTKHITS